MPPITVIRRTQDPGFAASQQAVENVRQEQDLALRRKKFKAAAKAEQQRLKVQERNATSLEEQNKLKKEQQAMKFIEGFGEDPQTAMFQMRAAKNLGLGELLPAKLNDTIELLKGDPEFQEMLEAKQQQQQLDLQGQQIGNQLRSRLLQQMGGDVPQAGGAQGGTPTSSRAAAAGGQPFQMNKFNFDMESGEVGDVTFERPEMEDLPTFLEKDLKEEADTVNSLVTNAQFLINNPELEESLGTILSNPQAPVNRLLNKAGLSSPQQKAFLNAIEQAGQVYRVAVTGAQAGLKEIQLLLSIFPNKNMTGDQFLTSNYYAIRTIQNALAREIPIQESRGRDTRGMQARLNQYQQALEGLATALPQDVVQDLENSWQGFDFAKPGERPSDRVQTFRNKDELNDAIENGLVSDGSTVMLTDSGNISKLNIEE